jgi:hypothetical protein
VELFFAAVGDYDPNDLRQQKNSTALFPPEYYVDYLAIPEVMTRIGAESSYQRCADGPFEMFAATGDVKFPLC